jgi:4'-phosphopantetheinyl transferase
MKPGDVQFCYSRFGKPALRVSYGRKSLEFNLTHSNGLALLAVTRGRKIGIDVEFVRSDLAFERIAEQFFSARERAVLCSLPPEQQLLAFFNCWTRKEAYLKATGDGFTFDPHRLEVSVAPGHPATLLDVEDDHTAVERWSLVELTPEPGYKASLAIDGHGYRLRMWQWPS